MRRWPVELGKGPTVQALKQRRGLAVSSAFLILGPVVVNIGPVAPEAAAACTYSETVDGNANTSSDYTNAGGTKSRPRPGATRTPFPPMLSTTTARPPGA